MTLVREACARLLFAAIVCTMASADGASAGAGGGEAPSAVPGVGVAADVNTPLPEGAVLLAQGAEAVSDRIRSMHRATLRRVCAAGTAR